LAGILKKPGSPSPFWFAAYPGVDGRRVQKSTKTTERAKALKIAVELESLVKQGRAGVLVDSQVRRVVAELYGRRTGTPLHFKSIAEYFSNWLQNRQGSTTAVAFAKYKQIAESFLSIMGKRAQSTFDRCNAAGPPKVA
jgi:hypothetical protein